jgi:hypothetical protein
MSGNRVEEIDKMLLTLSAYFRYPLTEGDINLYHRGLEDLAVERIRDACFQILKTGRFFPKITELRELAAPPVMALEDQAQVQAGLVLQKAREHGLNHQPLFGDPITRALLRGRFSWRSICDLTSKEQTWFVKEFIQAYRAYGTAGEAPLQLEAPGPSIAKLLKGIGGS